MNPANAALQRVRRDGPRWLAGVCAVLAAVVLYLLAKASSNTNLFARDYLLLLGLSGALALGLAVLVVYQLMRLRRKLSANVFGARLTRRLVMLFALVGVLPGVLVYGVSVQFVARSIESWFDVRVENALEGGLNLGRTTLDNQLHDLAKKADAMAFTLATQPVNQQLAQLNLLREQAGLQEATLFTPRGDIIGFSSARGTVDTLPDTPAPDVLRQLRLQRAFSAIETAADQKLYLRVLTPVNVLDVSQEMRVLQLVQPVPADLARDAEIVQKGRGDYQELMLARDGLRRLYGVALTVTLLIALLSALSLAFALSEQLSAPLSYLAEGTRAVAQGDFSARGAAPGTSRDELGTLTESFNAMRRQLADARGVAERNQAQLASAHAYLQSVLVNLSAGVLALDDELRLRSFNRSAADIVGVDFSLLMGVPLETWGTLAPEAESLTREIAAALRSDQGEWEKQIERMGPRGAQALLVRGARLQGGGAGLVLVFDDITQVLQAQRDAAWSEVARRLAHEIKNPLTPIQLSAERLESKLADKLDAESGDMLRRATRTIVNQVGALKHMVDAFRQYSRLPDAILQPLDFNALLREVLTLYEPLGAALHADLAPDLALVAGDPAQLRQVVHNLLQNAQDALAGVERPRIVVRSERAGGKLRVTVTDNGAGFPEALMQRAFEPYVTTKPKGTGLGLVMVKKIVDEHGGTVRIENVAPHGARVTLTLPFAAAQLQAGHTAEHA